MNTNHVSIPHFACFEQPQGGIQGGGMHPPPTGPKITKGKAHISRIICRKLVQNVENHALSPPTENFWIHPWNLFMLNQYLWSSKGPLATEHFPGNRNSYGKDEGKSSKMWFVLSKVGRVCTVRVERVDRACVTKHYKNDQL